MVCTQLVEMIFKIAVTLVADTKIEPDVLIQVPLETSLEHKSLIQIQNATFLEPMTGDQELALSSWT